MIEWIMIVYISNMLKYPEQVASVAPVVHDVKAAHGARHRALSGSLCCGSVRNSFATMSLACRSSFVNRSQLFRNASSVETQTAYEGTIYIYIYIYTYIYTYKDECTGNNDLMNNDRLHISHVQVR